MDILNSLSRWIVGKRGEMHQLFEQCAQGYPRKEASVVGAAKRLTHSQTDGGVLEMLRRLPMGMAMGIGMDSVTPGKYPHQMGPVDGMKFPVVGPKGVPDMGSPPPHSQCLGGNPGSVTVSPAKNNISQQQQHLKQPSFPPPLTDPGKYHDVFQYTGTKNTLPQANQPTGDHFQELSKSSMWKHIFAPPFTPACANNKYPYSMAGPAPQADLSHLYPYANRAENATETMYVGPAHGYPSGGYLPGAPCFNSHLGMLSSECQAFSPTPTYSFSRPYVPCYISVIGQPSPMQVQQCQQHIFIPPAHSTVYCPRAQKAFPGARHKPCHTTSAQQSAPSPTQYTQSARGKMQPPATPSKQDDSATISEVVNGIESLHVSPQMDRPTADMNPTSSPVDSPTQSVQSSKTTALELDCDNQLQADTAEVDSSESALSDNKNNEECAQADSSVNLHGAHIEIAQEIQTPKSQPHISSSNKDSNIFRHPCAVTPNTNPRKKRKCRPSAEKRRRRHMPAVCAVSTKPTPTRPSSDAASSSKKLKTDHVVSSEEAPGRHTMSASVAFILGLDSEEETEDTEADLKSASVKPSHVKSFCFSISSLSDSDSDFDDVSEGSDTTDGMMDEMMWGGLNFSLDPFKFQCLSSTPIPITKTMSSPQLTSCAGNSEPDAKHPLSWSPTRRTSLGKHVKFASEDMLVTVHTIDDELDAYQEARKGDWEQFARDRCRFKDRSQDVEKAICWVFDPDHRARVQRLFLSYSKSSSSQ